MSSSLISTEIEKQINYAASEEEETLPVYYSFQTSSMEFFVVIYTLYIPEEAVTLAAKVTLLSQIYQVITRARAQLIIVADPLSLKFLNAIMNIQNSVEIQEIQVWIY